MGTALNLNSQNVAGLRLRAQARRGYGHYRGAIEDLKTAHAYACSKCSLGDIEQVHPALSKLLPCQRFLLGSRQLRCQCRSVLDHNDPWATCQTLLARSSGAVRPVAQCLLQPSICAVAGRQPLRVVYNGKPSAACGAS